MIDVPSRAELCDEVDVAFHAAYPSAPARMNARRPQDAAWRRRWLIIRDKHLRREVDRIYRSSYPDAPPHLDLADPAHDRYRQLWLDIRRSLWDNAPEPPADDDGDIDLSYLGAGVNESLLWSLPEIRTRVGEACA
jgi:hypothetical protein